MSTTSHTTDLSYLTRTEPLYDPDPSYRRSYAYDVVYCNTCNGTEIEPEITECEGCKQDVCPHCCGTRSGYHELCRQQVDDEIDPLLDRRAFAAGRQQTCGVLSAACLALMAVLSTYSFCLWCDARAPTDLRSGAITGPIPHRDGCAYVQARTALAMAQSESPLAISDQRA